MPVDTDPLGIAIAQLVFQDDGELHRELIVVVYLRPLQYGLQLLDPSLQGTQPWGAAPDHDAPDQGQHGRTEEQESGHGGD